MNTDAIIVNKNLANRTQQYSKRIVSDQMEFIPEMQHWFTLKKKKINVIHHINKSKRINHIHLQK